MNQSIKIGTIIRLPNGKRFIISSIDGDFSMSLKNLDPEDYHTGQGYYGNWQKQFSCDPDFKGYVIEQEAS